MIERIGYRIFSQFPECCCVSRWIPERDAPGEGKQGEEIFRVSEMIEVMTESQPAVLARQVQSSIVKNVISAGVADKCDGLVTSTGNLNLVIRTADCAAVMIYDPVLEIAVNLHVGWRGVYSAIIGKALDKLTTDYNSRPQDCIVAVSPAIGSCCYQVGPEFRNYFDAAFLTERNGMLYFDLKGMINTQLIAAGVPPDKIEISAHCTRCSSLQLPSYRRNFTRNRIWNIIKIKGE
ncbi:MAG: laccase domain-containing protein [Calditrichaeota bacterium]|nr:polyphenol oxidase family protein [Calditrichota bacterium]RQV92940.1 MAG: laccase domain-containing protein [bacterium]RQW07987.1 MAG: laccase domain-containing protein [Calditrichota bacterium]